MIVVQVVVGLSFFFVWAILTLIGCKAIQMAIAGEMQNSDEEADQKNVGRLIVGVLGLLSSALVGVLGAVAVRALS